MKKHSTSTFHGSRHELMDKLNVLTGEGYHILTVMVDPCVEPQGYSKQSWLIVMFKYA